MSAAQALDPAAPAPRRRTALALVAVAAAVAAYANTLLGGFVYDDRFQVVENPWLRGFGNVPRAFGTNVWAFEGGVSNYYRPLMHVSYILTYAVAGLRPWAFHAVNVLLHAAVTALAFLAARRCLEESGAEARGADYGAFAAALLFATHPIHTEVVAWVACVPDLLLGLLALLAILLHRRPSPWARAGAVGSVFAGLFAKETMAVVPLLLLCGDLAFERPRARLPALARRYLPYAGAVAAYAAIRLAAMPVMAPIRRHAELGPLAVAANALPLLADQLRALLLPVGLNVFHVLHPVGSLLEPRGLASLAVAMALALALAWTFRRAPGIFFALAATAVPLLPVLYIPALGENSFAERYLYLPSFGLVLLAGLAVARLADRRPAALPWALGAAAAVAALYAGGAVARNRVWRDDLALWTDTVAKSPDSAYAHVELGILLAERGELVRAIEEYRTALRLAPGMARAHGNLGVAYEKAGRLDLALPHHLAAVQLDPAYSKGFVNLGNAYAAMGRRDEAVAQYRTAVRLRPDRVEFHISLANALSDGGDREGAMAEYRAALALDPSSADAHLHVGIALGEQGRLGEAIEHLETAARLAPDDPVVHVNLAQAYRLGGQAARAEEEMRRAGRR